MVNFQHPSPKALDLKPFKDLGGLVFAYTPFMCVCH